MAVDNKDKQSTPAAHGVTSGRRMAIGANVILGVAVATGLLVAVNVIGSLKSVRKDIGALGSYGLSDATKKVLSEHQNEMKLWWVYPPDEEDEKQQTQIDRLDELLTEMKTFAPGVEITHITSDTQRERLVDRLSQAFGAEGKAHKDALAEFDKMKAEVEAEIQQQLKDAEALVNPKEPTWLGDFPLFAQVISLYKKDLSTLQKSAEEIKELAPEQGIPKFSDATSKAAWTLGEVKQHLEAVAKTLSELATLSAETGQPDAANIKMFREVAADVHKHIGSLRGIVGKNDAPKPEGLAGVLKTFVDRSVEVSKELNSLATRVDNFSRSYPMVQEHPNWTVGVRNGPFVQRIPVKDVFNESSKMLQDIRLKLLGILDTKNEDEVAKAFDRVREEIAVLENNAEACNQLLTGLADRLSTLDPGSKAMLDAAKGDAMFKDRITALDKLKAKLEGLPQLKSSSYTETLKENNIVIVEFKDLIRVVKFDDVFPIRQSVAGGTSSDDSLGRTFNGDGAISTAMVSLTRDKPFGTVVFISFEPPPMPQMNQMFQMPPGASWIPAKEMSKLRERLEGANYRSADWNMGKDEPHPPIGEYLFGLEMKFKEDLNKGVLPEDARKEFAKRGHELSAGATVSVGKADSNWRVSDGDKKFVIKSEDERRYSLEVYSDTGTVVYVVLPAARPGPPNPFAKGMKEREITDAEIQKVRDLLDKNYGVIFLATWEVTKKGVMGSEGFEVPRYEYADLLKNDWGITVDNQRRLIWVVPDHSTPDGFGVNAQRFTYMPASGFSEASPLGKPMSGTRFLVNDACPIELADTAPQGVNRETVMTLPESNNIIAANIGELVQVIDELQAPGSDGIVELRPPPMRGSFGTMVVASREKEEKPQGRVAVLGFGACLKDSFQGRPVIAEGASRLRFDPPPSEHLDLFVNTLHWVQGEPEWIARGPAAVKFIGELTKDKQRNLRIVVWGAWPLIVLLLGAGVWFMRRK